LEPGQPLENLSSFAKAYGDEYFCERLLRKYSGDIHKSKEKFKQALLWREQHEELLTKRVYQESGDLRVLGFDLKARPILYQCTRNQLLPNGQSLDMYVVRMLQGMDLMAPGVSKMTHIWDLHGLNLRMNLSISATLQLMQVLDGYFAETTHEIIVIDVPAMAQFLKDAIWPLLPDRTKRKIHVLKVADAKLRVQACCDNDTASRICEVMDQNRNIRRLEERRQTWMHVVNKHGDLAPVCRPESSSTQ